MCIGFLLTYAKQRVCFTRGASLIHKNLTPRDPRTIEINCARTDFDAADSAYLREYDALYLSVITGNRGVIRVYDII